MRFETMLKDCAEYEGVPTEDAEEIFVKRRKENEKLFPKKPTKKNLRDYYSKNKHYYVGLEKSSFLFNTIKDYNTLQILLLNLNIKKVLDFGCGSGVTAMRLASTGFDVTAVDFEGKTLDFLRWKNKKHNLKMKVFGLNKFSWEEKYDAVVCFDVLEHVKDPFKLTKKLINMIPKNGFFILTAEFSGQDIHTEHIAPTDSWVNIKKLLVDNGFYLLTSINLPNGQKYNFTKYPLVMIKK